MFNLFIFLIYTFLTPASCQVKSHNSNIKAPSPADSVQDFRNRTFSNDSFPSPVGYVNDFENIFTLRQEQILDSLITVFEKRTTIEFAVVTIDTSMLSQSSLFDFTFKLANVWGVGKKDKKNGILIGICSANRDFRIQNGYGIEPYLSDSTTSDIMTNSFFPSYKKGLMFEGTFLGLKSIMETLVTSIDEKTKVTF